MAGRLNISDHKGLQWLLEALDLQILPEHFTARFNVAPLSALWGLTLSRGQAIATPMQWGFIPPWAKPGQFPRPLTVARAETIHERPSFRPLIRRYRGLLPINGFYEWSGRGNNRVPHYICDVQQPALAVATLCQMHGDGYHQCCVITTRATDPMSSIHKRQPLLISREQLSDWLLNDTPAAIEQYLMPTDLPNLRIQAISDYVNTVTNEGSDCLQPRAC